MCGGTQEAGITVAESLVALYRVGTILHQIRRGWKAARSSTSQGSAEKARTGRFRWEKLMSDHGPFFFLRGPTRSGEPATFVGLFQGRTGLWTARCLLARWLHQLKASTTVDLGISIFLVVVRCVALRNLDLLMKTDWRVNCPLCCRERWLWVGDNNPSRSRLLTIWSKEV